MQMFWGDNDQPLAINQIHPCVIGYVPCLVHHPDLGQEDPQLFRFLQEAAARTGYELRSDRRHARLQTVKKDRRWRHRKKWVPLILLSASMAMPNLARATEQALVSVKAFVSDLSAAQPDENSALNALIKVPAADSEAHWQESIQEILTAHWRPGENDPQNLADQIQGLSHYYSRFPEVRRLLAELRDLPWLMEFFSNRFSTEIFGTKKAVHSAHIYFDPTSAAQLQFSDVCIASTAVCVASPADLLLHEMLHVYQVFRDPVRFIAQTDAARGSYLHSHERETIELEQQLYSSMTAVDKLQRPSRSTHLGKAVTVGCFICIE